MPDLTPSGSAQIDPGFGVTLVGRMRALLDRGQIGAAELLLPILEKRGDVRESAVAIKAEIALARGRTQHAAEILAQGLERFPADPALLVLRAEIGFSERDFVTAAVSAAEAVIAQPANAEAKSLLGRALLELGRTDQAAICLREACQAMPTHAPTRLALARAAPEDGETILRSGIAAAPSDIALRNALIRTLLAQNALEAAQTELITALDIGCRDIETQLLAIEVAARVADWAEAARLCDSPEFAETIHA